MGYSEIHMAVRNWIRCTGFAIFFLSQNIFLSYSQLPQNGTQKIHQKSFSEEIYINTDRDLYTAGEKVWFKICMLNGLTNTPVSISKVAYADILDLENNPVIQLKIAMDGYSGSGNFTLPDTLRSGNYLLRAYTSWMQNFSKDLFACKSISVINPFDKISNLKILQSAMNPDSVIFYPEGGLLLSGFESLLGFKTLDRQGSPVIINGFIVTEKNDTVCSAKTGLNGYGLVRLKPLSQTRLFLVCSEKGQLRKFRLPDVQKEGILISAPQKAASSGAIAVLHFSQDYIQGERHLYLLIKSPGLSGLRKEIKQVSGTDINISTSEFPFGVSHLSVVDEKDKILTDRWISREYKNPITFKISFTEKSFSQRQKIRIDILAADNRGNPVESDFTVSVAKAVSINRKEQSNLYRLMPGLEAVRVAIHSGDINDYLVFYKSHEAAADRNGAGDNSDPAYLPEIEGHLISGIIKERISGEPLRNENITLSFVGKSALCFFTKTDDNGNFNFITRENGLKEMVIQPLTPEKECYVDLNNPFSSGYADYDHGSFSPDTSKLNEINNLIISMQINNIYEPFYKSTIELPEEQPEYNFYGPPENSILMSNYIELTSVKEIIAELIPGVGTTRNNGKINFRLTKSYQTKPFEHGPLVLVDGIPVYDLEKVIGISSKDIEKVDVLIDRYYISGNILDGILHFITKKGNLSVIDLDRSVFRLEYDLLQRKEPFYSPDYSADSLRNNHLPDFRNTLYWNPDLHTDKTGKASVEFYSSDESAQYFISVDGMTIDGRHGTSFIPLKVMSK